MLKYNIKSRLWQWCRFWSLKYTYLVFSYLNITRFEEVEWGLPKWYDVFSNLKIQIKVHCIMPEVFLVSIPVYVCGACLSIANGL